MMNRRLFEFLILLTAFATQLIAQDKAPMATIRPTRLEQHGITRIDDYFWLRERENPAVLAYLNAENEYFNAQMADTQSLQSKLFEEIVARIPDTETSAPVPDRGFVYWNRIDRQQQYPVFYRKPVGGGADQVLLDVNQLANGQSFCSVPNLAVSSGNNVLAYAVDLVGRRKYTIHFKNLDDGKLFPESIVDVTADFVWAEDNRTLFYTRQDPDTLRAVSGLSPSAG